MSKRTWPCIMIAALSLGEAVSAHIVSIAAIGFDPATSDTQPLKDSLYMLIDIEDSLRNGATIDRRSWQAIIRTPPQLAVSISTNDIYSPGCILQTCYSEFTAVTQLNSFIKLNLATGGTIWNVDAGDSAHMRALSARADHPLGYNFKDERCLTTFKAMVAAEVPWPEYQSLDMRDIALAHAHLAIRCHAALTFFKAAATPMEKPKHSKWYDNDYDPERSKHHVRIDVDVAVEGADRTEVARQIMEEVKRPLDVQMLIDQAGEPEPEPDDWWKHLNPIPSDYKQRVLKDGRYWYGSAPILTELRNTSPSRGSLIRSVQEYIKELESETDMDRTALTPDHMNCEGFIGDLARATAFLASLYRPGDDDGVKPLSAWHDAPEATMDTNDLGK